MNNQSLQMVARLNKFELFDKIEIVLLLPRANNNAKFLTRRGLMLIFNRTWTLNLGAIPQEQ